MPSTKEITLFIALIVLAILFLVVIIAFGLIWSKRKLLEVEKQRQKELIRVVVQTEQIQKTKIASDLHDHMILSALNLNTKIIKLENGESIDFLDAKEEVKHLASIVEEIRDIAYGIIPKMFTSFGVIKSIEIAVKQLNGINNATAVFENLTSFRSELPYSIVYQLSIYNAVLEILNNLRKHSNYESLIVTLEDSQEFFTLVFAHDGVGVTNDEIKVIAEAGKGIGLMSLQSRIIALDAVIDYKKEIGISSVCLKFPVNNENSN